MSRMSNKWKDILRKNFSSSCHVKKWIFPWCFLNELLAISGFCVPTFKLYHLLASNRGAEYFYLEIHLEWIPESPGSINCTLVREIFTFFCVL